MDLEGALASFVEELERRKPFVYTVIDADGTVIERRVLRGGCGQGDEGPLTGLTLRVVDPPPWRATSRPAFQDASRSSQSAAHGLGHGPAGLGES